MINHKNETIKIIKSVVDEVDPLNFLAQGMPDNEYDIEVDMIINRITDFSNPQVTGKKIYNIFVEAFDLETAGDEAIYLEIAEKLKSIEKL